jgi:hypothetical protein
MRNDDRESRERQIRARVREIHEAWLSGRLERLGVSFHPSIVMVLTGA